MVNKQALARATKKYRAAHPERVRDTQKNNYAVHRLERCTHQRDKAAALKLEVLTHYGHLGYLECCWENCVVCDVDMLTLDHVENNGAQERKSLYGENKGASGGSHRTYARVKREGYPEGYQTLCWNHQWKKQLATYRG